MVKTQSSAKETTNEAEVAGILNQVQKEEEKHQELSLENIFRH